VVAVARYSLSANRIRAHGHPVRTNESTAAPLDAVESARKTVFLALSPQQREVLAELLVWERAAAVHDVLAYLDWATTTDVIEMKATGEGSLFKSEDSLHGDYMARLTGWNWPE
jgi:hypothetical protein